MKRYGSRRNDNEYGDRAPVHGAKSSRARAKRESVSVATETLEALGDGGPEGVGPGGLEPGPGDQLGDLVGAVEPVTGDTDRDLNGVTGRSRHFDEPVIVVRRPFVPNVKLIRESFAKIYGDVYDDDAPADASEKPAAHAPESASDLQRPLPGDDA